MGFTSVGFRCAARALLLAALGWGAIGAASAEVTIAGTRVIYPAQQREVAVKLNNAGARPALVQVWVDDGDPKQSPDTSKAPFLVSPPVVRIEPGKGQALRLIYGGKDAAAAAAPVRESVYWLNVLEIPPGANPAETDQNHLQVAFRTRIKVFLRPPGLPGDAEAAARDLRWRVVRGDGGGWALECANASAFHVSFNRVSLNVGGREFRFDNAGMLAPGAQLRLALDGLNAAPPAGTRVDYAVINDYGGRAEHSGQTAD
ncbi:fimbrial biogenesis chaperone [Pseudomonas sp. CGJS7]|uniref:fimbrial biogenesis chaperone n=1 Tax=Pseudomonas sp. CGJS7 TaxID=3109348 RepID=UPI00300B6843